MLIRTAILALVLFGINQQSTPTLTPATQPAPAQGEKAGAQSTAAPAHVATSKGMATVYFYRPRLYRGSASRIGVFVDGTMAVNLVNGRWAAIQVPAGHHVVKPKDDQSGIEIDMEAGQSYYFRSGWGEEGLFHGPHKNIMLVMKEQATYEIKQLKPLDEKDVVWPAAQATDAKK